MLNKRRVHDKWIIPKNNKGINRHRVYVAFVVQWKLEHNDFPTTDEYLENIIDFLISLGANKPGKKTSKEHQLYQPVFLNILKEESGRIVPTKKSISFMFDSYGRYESILLLSMMYESSFKTGATGSKTDFDDIFPIKELIDNLLKYGEISFADLNKKFYSKTPGIDIKVTKPLDGKSPSWSYVLSILEDVKLISSDGRVLKSKDNSSNKAYNPKSLIFAADELKKYILKINETDFIYEMFSQDDIDNVLKYSKSFYGSDKGAKQRDSLQQNIYRVKLLELHKERCQMCQISTNGLLVASHIKPHAKCEIDEEFDIQNGLLLCALHDTLFDKGYITLAENKILYSSSLAEDEMFIKKTITKHLKLNEENNKYMKYHNKNVFKK